MRTDRSTRLSALLLLAGALGVAALAGPLPTEGPALGPSEERLRMTDLASGEMTLTEVRAAGLRIFATPFRKADGFGDGPMNPGDPTTPGGRPTLGPGAAFLRVNGLDAQACVECHSFVSTTTVPPLFGVGGFGAAASAPLLRPRRIDVADELGNGFAEFDGRLIVPPHLFGSGGIQLLAREMTEDLRAKAEEARARPGADVALRSKGVSFGTVRSRPDGTLETDRVRGVDPDLVVRPFGRKGEFATVGDFGREALRFHMGMEPEERDEESFDDDGDGVWGEVGVAELAALEIFMATLDRPVQLQARDVGAGALLFSEIGCAECHRPFLDTRSEVLPFFVPGSEEPVFAADLSAAPPRFRRVAGGGVRVPLFSDLKRHDMGPELAETFHEGSESSNREFVTARLWGVGDSAPYLHDGRAHTLGEAIEMHGGEARSASDAFRALGTEERAELLRFLASLRLPRHANSDLGRASPAPRR